MHKIDHIAPDSPTHEVLVSGLDTSPLLEELASATQLWDRHDYRWRNDFCQYEGKDILLRFQDTEPPDNEMIDLECYNYPAWYALPKFQRVTFSLMQLVKGTRLGRVMVVALPKGARVGLHIDVGPPAEYYSRFHLVLQSGPGCVLYIGEDAYTMKAGDFVWLNHNEHIHRVENISDFPRISLILDIHTDLFKENNHARSLRQRLQQSLQIQQHD